VPHVRRTAPGKFAVATDAALLVDGDDCVVGGSGGHGCGVSSLRKKMSHGLRQSVHTYQQVEPELLWPAVVVGAWQHLL